MADKNTTEEQKGVEQTFDQKLGADGWPSYYLSAKLEDLGNPDPKHGTVGARDALTKKQIVIDAPIEEWIALLTKLAKKQGAKS